MKHVSLALCWLLVVTTAAMAMSPPRPTRGDANNFYMLVGIDQLDYKLDPRGAVAFAEAGLDIQDVSEQGAIGVGWVLAHPIRLDLIMGGGTADLQRDDVDCNIGRALAELHVAVLELGGLTLEGSLAMGAHAMVIEGLAEDETIPGVEVGVGANLTAPLFSALGLAASYRWGQARYQRANIKLADDEVIRVHPTGSFHSFRVLLTLDL